MNSKDSTVDLGAELSALPADQRGHHIDGAFLPLDDSRCAVVLNPSTGQPIVEVADGDAADVALAVAAAKRALPAWRRATPRDRAARLLALATLIEQHSEHLARLESLNVGKPLGVSRAEIPLAVDALQFFAGAARTAQAPAPGEYVEGQLSIIRREPLGVIAAITPWNYPLMMAVWKIAPALAAGNTVVLKPSEMTPLTTLRLAKLAAQVLPPGVFNVVLGTGPNVGEALTAHPDVAMVALTGSVRSGKAVARGAADTLKRAHLELGGKAPVVVFPDADLDAVVEAVKVAGFWNTGQECGAATRLLVHSSIHDDVVTRLVAAVQTLTVGDPSDSEGLDMGPLISEKQRDNVAGFVERAIDDGAEVLCGGSAPARPGWFYEPTILGNIKEGSEIDQEEVFGPVVSVSTFDDEADAVRMANSVRYGLSASVWTTDSSRGLRMSAELGLRHGLDQQSSGVGLRNAVDRLRRIWLRPRPVHVRTRRLHADQARHGRSGRSEPLTIRRGTYDAVEFSASDSDRADVIIVGAGPSGAVVAKYLTGFGFHVVCLEQGGWVKTDEYTGNRDEYELSMLGRWSKDGNVRALPEDYPCEISNSDITPVMYNAVGGGSVHYGGMWPRFLPSDFRLRSLHGIADDWPFTWEELAPFYTRNEKDFAVAGMPGDPAFPKMPAPPMPAHPINDYGRRFAQGMNAMGWHWWPAPNAIAAEPVLRSGAVRALRGL